MNSKDEIGEIVGTESAVTPSIHSRSFRTLDAAAVVGISAGKLQNWLTRGAIQLEGTQNPGRGQSRDYSAYEVARIALMKKLSDCGVPLGTAFKITSVLKEGWERVVGGHEQYGTEPDLQSWIIVVQANDWPAGRKGSLVPADAHIAVWLVDQISKPDADRGLRETLLALKDVPAVIVNMGRALHDTITKLEAISS